MIIAEGKNRAFIFFDFFLRILALTHWYWLTAFEYYFFDPTTSYRYPVIKILGHESVGLHTCIFIFYTISVFIFALKRDNHLFSFIMATCLIYFEFHDKYSFHQDIFLAINIFILFSFAKYFHINNKIKAREDVVFALKVLCSLVYFFAGFHKMNPFFHSGILLEDILMNGPLRHFVKDIPFWIPKTISYYTLIVELSFPILIWTKWRKAGVILAVFLHFGIAIFGLRGMLFNLYLPCLWLLFFNFNKVDLIDIRLRKILPKIDFFDSISNNVIYKKLSWRELKMMLDNFIILNPVFLAIFIAFMFNLLIISRKLLMNFL